MAQVRAAAAGLAKKKAEEERAANAFRLAVDEMRASGTLPPTPAPSTPAMRGSGLHQTTPELPTDFVVLAAIEVERRAVCDAFGMTEDDRVRRGSRVYWRRRLPLKNGRVYQVVVTQSRNAANVDMALVTNDALHHWTPGAALLLGIAATARPEDVVLGDLVLGSACYYYERGKFTPEGKRPEPQMFPPDTTLWNNVTALPDWNGALPVTRPDATAKTPRVHKGVIASGEKVIADAAVRDEIAAGHRKILAIEMEGYGFGLAALQSFDQVRHLVIRAICDEGSVTKDDRWHEYAASAAAHFGKHFLLDCPLPPRNA